MTDLVDVCIIGGGIQGCSAALELVRRGVSVTVIERDYPGRQASGVNAGGLRRMNRAIEELPLSLASHEIWLNIKEHVGDDCGFTQSNNISIAETEEELVIIKERVNKIKRLGFHHEEIINSEQVNTYLPKSNLTQFGALFCDGDGFASPFKTTNAFFKAAKTEGTKFRLGETVVSLEKKLHWQITTNKRKIEAQVLLNCAGAWGNKIAKMVGDIQVVHSEAPTMSITEPVPFLTKSIISFVGRRLSFKQRNNGTLLIGGGYRGTVNVDGISSRISLKTLAENCRAVVTIFPQLANVKIIRSWAGVEGMTPDHLPIISPSETVENLYHAFGFSSHGFQLGPIVGKILADLAIEQKTHLPIEPFKIGRFGH